jgi:hypothetical protein
MFISFDNVISKKNLSQGEVAVHLSSRPLQNAPFCPISASGSNFNPQNTRCIPAVKIFTFLELEQK